MNNSESIESKRLKEANEAEKRFAEIYPFGITQVDQLLAAGHELSQVDGEDTENYHYLLAVAESERMARLYERTLPTKLKTKK